jgi:hypothetical protein
VTILWWHVGLTALIGYCFLGAVTYGVVSKPAPKRLKKCAGKRSEYARCCANEVEGRNEPWLLDIWGDLLCEPCREWHARRIEPANALPPRALFVAYWPLALVGMGISRLIDMGEAAGRELGAGDGS